MIVTLLAAAIAAAPQVPGEQCSERFDVRIRLLGEPAVGARVQLEVDVRLKVGRHRSAKIEVAVPGRDVATFRRRITSERTRITVPIELVKPLRGYVFVTVDGTKRRPDARKKKRWFAYRYLHLDVGPNRGRWGLGELDGRSKCTQTPVMTLGRDPAAILPEEAEPQPPHHQQCAPCGIPIPENCTAVAWHGDPCDSARCGAFVCREDERQDGIIDLSK